MGEAFGKIFWGFLIVLIEIHLFAFDVLPDPVGYYFIYSGISMLLYDYPLGKKASNWAIVLCFLSIPSVFISQNEVNQMVEVISFSQIYTTIMGIVKVILSFYVLQLMLKIAEERGGDDLRNGTSKFFRIYIITMMSVQILTPFAMNTHGNLLIMSTFITVLLVLILEIMFLVLIRRFKKLDN
ncbi:hypothetical protein [Oceanobacillus senegalensis]|uniref:hypothetical protein n=1 Tax=Oceanobacillus senegalensis TaxID=1936063 RepID=UPI000A311AED|nr:hypothetical protein [Oceanobacillus senegalensis]